MKIFKRGYILLAFIIVLAGIFGISKDVKAVNYTLTVTKGGTNPATGDLVYSIPSGLNCGAGGTTCSASYSSDTWVQLRVVTVGETDPTVNHVFVGWSGGGCSGTGDCWVLMNANKTITASFNFASVLTISKFSINSGSGTVTSSPAGINCGSTCFAKYDSYNVSKTVNLTATPSVGSTFYEWSGGPCNGTATNPCSVVMGSVDFGIIAKFANPATFTITKSGSGSGTVTSSPAGISCGATCSASFSGSDHESKGVTLIPTASPGSVFVQWSGNDQDCINGIVIMNVNKTCNAEFRAVPLPYTLTITKSGSGAGTVTSSPVGINCGADCSKNYPSGASIILTATPAAGSVFQGWRGDQCFEVATSKTCTVTMETSKTVDAIFYFPTFTLTPSSVSKLIGQTQQFDGYHDADGPDDPSPSYLPNRTAITWSSSDSTIATINFSGLATGVAVGSVTISGVYQGITATASLTITSVPAVIDLTAINLVVHEGSLIGGGPPYKSGVPIALTASILNQGDLAVSSSIYARFCIDNIDCLNSNVGAIDFTDFITTSSLSANATYKVNSGFITPTQGNHTAYFCVDTRKTIAESDEGNNCVSKSFTVDAPPDLISQNLAITGDLIEGNPIVFSGEVKNLGPTSDQFVIAFCLAKYLGTTVTPDSNNCLLKSSGSGTTGNFTVFSLTNFIGPLDQNGVLPVTSNNWIAEVGSNTIYLCADEADRIGESIENNNCISQNFTVAPTPKGDISVKATLDGSPWTSALGYNPLTDPWASTVSYTLSGPETISGSSVAATFMNKPSGTYTLNYSSGGPAGAVQASPFITPVSSQFLPGNSTIIYTMNFISAPPAPLTASCAPSPNTQQINNNVAWNANASGSAGSYTYSWSGTDGLSGATQSVTKSYPTTGTKTGSVTVTSGSETKTVACTNLTVTDTSNKLLTLAKNIAPGGTVSSSPAGINCGVGCPNQSASFANSTLVNLIATPSSGYTFSGWGNCSTQSTSPLSVTMNADKNCNANFAPVNAPPTAVAGISLNTTTFSSSINVKRGVATTFYLSSWRGTQSSPTSKSDDPNGWTSSTLGMYSSPAKCEWDTDLVKNAGSFAMNVQRTATPFSLSSFSECSDPDANASNYITLTKTFNDVPGTYTYYVLKMTDRAGGVSSPLGTVQVKVLAQCEDGIDNDGDGKIDFGGANPDPDCSSGGDDDETTPPPLTFPDLTASIPTPAAAFSGAITFSSTISNGGTAATGAGFINMFQISLSSNGSNPTNYNTGTASSLSAGANVTTSKSITLTAGAYYMRVCADSDAFPGDGAITESNEGNNCSSGTPWTAITVTDPPIPVDGYYNGWNTCDSSCNQTAICIPPVNGGAACTLPAPTQSCTGGLCPIPPTNSGSCAPAHYGCLNGSSGNNESHTATWNWTCAGTDNIPVSCAERKRQPGYRED